MKLLYITNGVNGSGGLERVLSIKASGLADVYGYEVHIVGLNNSVTNLFYEFSPNITFHAVTVGGNPFRYMRRYVSGLRKLVKTIQPDCILVCDDGLKAFFLPFLLGKPCPMIYERHVSKRIEILPNAGTIARGLTNLKFGLMSLLARFYTKFVVLTEQNRNEWSGANVIVIPNPLSFYPEQSASLENKKVIAVGKQGYQKGYDRLLKSWKQIHDKHPDWELSIYGTFDPTGSLNEQAKELQIESSVHFYEPVKTIQEKFLESSVFVFSSRFEGFGMVLIEAMACGVPCVSFDCPYGPADIIQHNKDGLLVTNGDCNAFALRVIELIEDKKRRQEMGRTAKENVKRYLPEAILTLWDDLFKSVIK